MAEQGKQYSTNKSTSHPKVWSKQELIAEAARLRGRSASKNHRMETVVVSNNDNSNVDSDS
jgi:hypothetical protein